jgi:hypothetical protein
LDVLHSETGKFITAGAFSNNQHLTYAASHDEGAADRGEYRQASE